MHKLSYLLILIIVILFFISTSLISIASNVNTEVVVTNNSGDFLSTDFLTTNGTKIVNQNGEEVILRGYNLGLWLSRSFWGLPVVMEHNSASEERYSPSNSIEMDYELYSNPNLTPIQVEELNDFFYTNQITENDLDILAETGVNLVRVPFEWSFFMKPVYDENGENIGNADYNNYGALSYIDTTIEEASEEDKAFLEKRLKYLDWIVEECGKRKIYVIFDMHVAPGGLNTAGWREKPYFFEKGEAGEARRNCALRIWKIVAERFKNNPTIAGYDIVNEPSTFGTYENYINVIDFYDEAYKAIRAVERNCNNQHIIIMEGKVKSYSNSTVKIEKDENNFGLPNPSEKGWENVIYSRHDYFFNFKNQEEDKDKFYAEWEKDNPDIDIMKARIDNGIDEVLYTREQYNIPVWIGEFSCHAYYNDGNGNIIGTFQDANGTRYAFNKEYTDEIWKYQIQKYEEHNISYTAWTYKACWEKYFGLVYYSRIIDRVDLKASTYDEIKTVFSSTSAEVLRYNEELHNIMKKQLKIFSGVDISVNGDESVIAKLSSDKTNLSITGAGKMADFSTTSIAACEEYQSNILSVPPWYNYMHNITTVNIDENITNIGAHAFLNCKNLRNITIPSTVTKIGAYAFSQCDSLINIKFSDNVTNINMRAFWSCDKLNTVELGKSVSYIGKEVFNACPNLKNIYVYESNENYTGIEGVLYNKEKIKIVKYPEGKEDAEYIISSNVKAIEESAFYGSKLTNVIVSDSVTTIGENAFNNCSNLTIICKEGTKIESYANANNIDYVLDTGLPKIEFTLNGTNTVLISTKTKVNIVDTDVGVVSGIDYGSLKYFWGKRSEGVDKSEVVTTFSKDSEIITPEQQGTYYLWILARDNVGNEILQRSKAFSIDAIAPMVSVEVDSNGVAIITSNEELQEVNGWVLSDDKKTLTKLYTENITEKVDVYDLAGNVCKVNIEINNIQKEYFIVNTYEIENNYIVKIKSETIYEDFIKQIDTNINYIVKEGELVINGSNIIKTGQVLIVGEKKYTIVVSGDLNGDGKITATDISKIKCYIVNNGMLQGCYEKASDVNSDNRISITDLSIIKEKLVGFNREL